MKKIKTLLIIPPLDMPTHPYAAVPQLVTWLRAKGTETDALDLNIEYYNNLIDKERDIFKNAWAEFRGLNEKESLSEAESGRFSSLYRIFQMAAMLEEPITPDILRDERYANIRLMLANMFPAIAIKGSEDKKDMAKERVDYEISSARYFGEAHPASSSQLVSAVEKHSCFDNFFNSFMSDYLQGKEYTFIGISVPFFSQGETALRLARTIKKITPDTHVCLGGNYVGLQLSYTENKEIFKYIDSMSVGDGEISLMELAAALAGNGDLSTVSGLVYIKDGKIVRNKRAPSVPLEDIPVPDVIFDRAKYFHYRNDHFIRLRLSRGCSWGRCAFCNLVGCGLYSLQRPDEDKIFEKVRTLAERGEKNIYFGDDESDPAALARFAQRVIDEGLKFSWTTNIRFGKEINFDWAMLMKKAGCSSLAIGLESYCDRVLSYIQKGTSVDLIDNCLENLAWAGVPVLAYMMVGIPTETEEEAWESFNRLIKKYKEGYIKNVLYSLYSISKNSPIDKNPERFGVQILPMPQYIDLPCGAENFEHSGMSRDCAAKLQREFSARISEARTKAADEPENISSEETKSEVLCYMGEKIIPRADAEDISRTSYSNHAIMKIAIK